MSISFVSFRRSFRSAIRRGKTTANDAQIRVFAAVYDWRDRVARMEDESPEYVCDSRLIAAVARSRRPPRSYEDLVKMESNLPPLLSRPIMAVALKGAAADAAVGAVVGAVVGATAGKAAGKAAGKDLVDQAVESEENVEELGGGEGKEGAEMDRTNPSSTAVEPEVLWAAPPRPDVLESSCVDDEDGGGGEWACISYVDSFLAAVAVAADTPDVADAAPDVCSDTVEDTGGSEAAAAAAVVAVRAVVAEAVCEGGSGGEGKG